MSADAMARLRFALDHPYSLDGKVTDVRAADLRALFDAHDEALDALEELRLVSVGHVLRGANVAKALDRAHEKCRAVLAKAGRR